MKHPYCVSEGLYFHAEDESLWFFLSFAAQRARSSIMSSPDQSYEVILGYIL